MNSEFTEETNYGYRALVGFAVGASRRTGRPAGVVHCSLHQQPAPFPAQFSNLWLLWTCRKGKRYEIVDEAHKRLGKVIRIAPNHVSVADASAINTIYGHGNGFLKS